MSVLKDKVFDNRGDLSGENISKYKMNAIEDIGKDLVEFGAWDMVSPVATVVLKINEERISQCVLILLGET